MAIRIAINGFGRIGRSVLRALYESQRQGSIQIVAINDVAAIEASVAQLKDDDLDASLNVSFSEQTLTVAGDDIEYLSQVNPVKLPWKALDIDVVLECSGQFTQAEPAHMHILAGAKKVLISALSDEKVDATVVFGLNESDLKPEHKIVSNGSCTLNCLAHVAKILDDTVGIESGLSTTLHAYDSENKDASKSNALTPIKTRSPGSIGLVLPNLNGKLDGVSVRIPTLNVALLDLTIRTKKETSVNEINTLMTTAMKNSGSLFECNDKPVTSAAFHHHAASCIFDTTQTKVAQGRLVKVGMWFDNEWAFSNRMLDTAEAMMAC
ncbi:MAG: erythrose-4-phosphate dehydrogenase [Cycloclasticus sp. symbiont of Bathymodiolus heckerae]|nr:MAG: erythrose-4-phosphate dehydrogenase [Cycloclasticus sp. symbiont of Bathymodiolus heckerae]